MINLFSLQLILCFYSMLNPAPPKALHGPEEPFRLKGTSWITSYIPGQDKPERFLIFPAPKEHPYGNHLYFTDSVHFVSGNMGPCGNECRVSAYGRYYTFANTISLWTDSTIHWKQCAAIPPDRNVRFEGIFVMQHSGDTILFRRSKSLREEEKR